MERHQVPRDVRQLLACLESSIQVQFERREPRLEAVGLPKTREIGRNDQQGRLVPRLERVHLWPGPGVDRLTARSTPGRRRGQREEVGSTPRHQPRAQFTVELRQLRVEAAEHLLPVEPELH